MCVFAGVWVVGGVTFNILWGSWHCDFDCVGCVDCAASAAAAPQQFVAPLNEDDAKNKSLFRALFSGILRYFFGIQFARA